jgi:hypothetical protein
MFAVKSLASAPAMKAKSLFENEINPGPQGYFDPLGLVADGDQAKFDRLRYVEIKHGRIAMLAFLGQIVTRHGNHWDGAIDKAGDQYASFGNGMGALFGPDAIPGNGLLQIVALIGTMEVSLMTDWTETGEFPGDLRNGTFQGSWDRYSDKQKRQKRGVELNNGRAAMMGILGLMVHEQLGGSVPIVGAL